MSVQEMAGALLLAIGAVCAAAQPGPPDLIPLPGRGLSQIHQDDHRFGRFGGFNQFARLGHRLHPVLQVLQTIDKLTPGQ